MTVNRDTFVTADILAVISQVNDAVTIMTRAEKGAARGMPWLRLASVPIWMMYCVWQR